MALSAAAPRSRHRLIGREADLERLARGFAATRGRGGTARSVVVSGPDGVGKTVSIEQHLAAHEAARVIATRCYRGGRMPWGVFDAVAEAIADEIAALPEAEQSSLLPRDIGAAAAMLTPLRRVPRVADEFVAPGADEDPVQLRHRGFRALQELLAGLAAPSGLILVIDDADWLDVDALSLLRHVLWSDASEPPPVQAVLACRDPAPLELPEEIERIALGALSRAQLADLLRRSAPELDAERIDRIARAAGGNPRRCVALARWGGALRDAATAVDVLGHQLTSLEAAERRALEVVALAAQPVPCGAVARAAGVAAPVLDALVERGWLLRDRAHDREALDAADRDVHDAVVEATAPGVRARRYRDLAGQLELYGDAEADVLARLLHRAGDVHAAGRWAAVAARRAYDRFAFDRAAWFFRMALALLSGRDPDRHRLRVAQGEALARLGRALEAAHCFAEATSDAGTGERLDLHRRVVEEYLLAGDLDDALSAARAVLGDDVLTPPPSPTRRPSRMRSSRAALRWRTRRYEERDPGEIDPADLARIDLYWSLGVGLWPADHDLAVAYNTRQLLLALRVGEPHRIARGLAFEAAVLFGDVRSRRAQSVLDQAVKLTERTEDAYAGGFVEIARGVARAGGGHWREALAHWRGADALLRGGCRCVGFEHAAVDLALVAALHYLGELGELTRLVAERIDEAEERGAKLGSLALRTGHGNLAWLVRDDPDGAESARARARSEWHEQASNLIHADAIAGVRIALYRGRGREAWRVADEAWARWSRVSIARQRRQRIEALHTRAQAALAAAAEGSDELVEEAGRTARSLAGFRTPWTSALGQLVRAGSYAARGDVERTDRWLRAAESSLERAGLVAHAAAARRRRGELIGGARGKTLVANADALLRARGVAVPARFTDILVPWLRGRSS